MRPVTPTGLFHGKDAKKLQDVRPSAARAGLSPQKYCETVSGPHFARVNDVSHVFAGFSPLFIPRCMRGGGGVVRKDIFSQVAEMNVDKKTAVPLRLEHFESRSSGMSPEGY